MKLYAWIFHNNINNISIPCRVANFKCQTLSKTKQINPDTNVTRQILQITLSQTQKIHTLKLNYSDT